MKKRLPSHGRLLTALFTLAVGTSMLFSCSREMEMIGADQEDDSIEIVINVGTPDTKTDNSGNATLWSDGDALSVFHSASGATAPSFWSSWFGFYSGNSFQGTVRKLSSTNDWYAVYPYREDNVSPAAVSFTFPSRQTQVGNSNMEHFAGESFPLFGKTANVPRSEDLSISMGNLLVGVQFKIQNNTASPIVIQEVEFTAESYITGGFTVDMTGDSPVLSHGSSASKKVTLTVTDGDAIPAGQTALFNAAIAPYDVPAGGSFDIKVIGYHPDTPNSKIFFYITKTIESGTSFQAGHIKVVNVPFDESHSQNPDAGSAGEVELEVGEQPEDGEYLLVYENGENSMAFAPFADQKANKYAIPVNVIDGVVIPEDGEDLSTYAVTIEVAMDDSGSPITHSNDDGHYAYNVRNSEGQYVFYSTSGGTLDASDALQIKDINEMDIDGTTYKYYHTFVQATDGVQILSSIYGASGGNKYLLAYTSANGFYYEENNSGQKLHLYLLGGSVKEKQYPAFSAERVEYDFDANGAGILANAPTLSGAMTSVKYSSSNESVATVDATGKVTIHKAGSATITATAEADEYFYSASASYLVVATTSAGTTFYLATELTAGEQYLIVSGGKALTNSDGSIAATDISAFGDEILVSDAASMTWTATASGSGFTLANNGYYVQRASSSGGGKPNISNSPNTSYYVWNYSSDRLSTTSNSSYGGGSTYYLYYSSGWAQTSNASSAGSVTIYSSTKPLTKQNLSFNQKTVRWYVGEGEEHQLNRSYTVQAVNDAHTTVTYTSSKESVATISGTTLTIKGLGSTTITATAKEENGYKGATATYTLNIAEPAPEGFVDLGTFNLENAALTGFLDDASVKYPNDDKSTIANNTYASTSVISTYANWSSPSRKDIPAPVELSWDVASTGTATVTVYNDQALEDEVWTWTASEGSKSFDVYNLIPGLTYYCTVVDDNSGVYLLKGTFNTEGRRRMIMVSDKVNAGNANNCRDLGGLKTTDGRRIKYGLIFRGTNMTSTSSDEKRIIAEFMNVGLDNDLRSGSGGGSNRDNPFENTSYTVRYVGPGYSSTSDLQNASKYKQTIQAFLDAAKPGTANYNKASYFHCYIGADRTGYTGLMIEGLLGVSLTDCTIDYELTTFSTAAGSRPRNSSSMCYIKDAVTFLNKEANGGTGTTLQEKITYYFIHGLGISEADIENFKNWALEPDPEAN